MFVLPSESPMIFRILSSDVIRSLLLRCSRRCFAISAALLDDCSSDIFLVFIDNLHSLWIDGTPVGGDTVSLDRKRAPGPSKRNVGVKVFAMIRHVTHFGVYFVYPIPCYYCITNTSWFSFTCTTT